MIKDPWFRLMIAGTIAVAVFFTVLASTADSQPQERPEPRWVYVGDWDGLMRCESSPSRLPPLGATSRQRANEVRVDQTGGAGERSGFQFMAATWDGWARERNRPKLSGRDPWTFTLAQQLRQAEHGRHRYGLSQWTCGRHYGGGDGWIYVTAEHHLPRNPQRCADNLEHRHDIARRVARSVCAMTDTRPNKG